MGDLEWQNKIDEEKNFFFDPKNKTLKKLDQQNFVQKLMLTKLERGKLIIGGAQLGNKYGITNNKKVSLEDTTKILNYAKRKNINYLDLAESYNSHEKLKKIKLNNFKIIFKLNFKKNIKENYIKKNFLKFLNN